MSIAEKIQIDVKQFAADIATLSNEGVGCYLKLIFVMWNKGPLPLDMLVLSRVCGIPPERFQIVWNEIAGLFECSDEPAATISKRQVLEQRDAALRSHQKRSAAGKVGAETRWSKKDRAPANGVDQSSGRLAVAAGVSHGAPSDSKAAIKEICTPTKKMDGDIGACGSLFDDFDNDNAVVPPKADRLNCPHDRIIDIYHQILPTAPRVIQWNETRKALLKSRWLEMAKTKSETIGAGYETTSDGMAWWTDFFRYVSKSNFLTGKASAANGATPFVASLEWLLRPSNFTKVLEGNYHR